MSLQDKLKQDQQSDHAKKGGSWFKFKEGDNKLRVLTEPIAIYEDYKLGMCYTDCRFQGSIKYLSYIYDFSDNAVKLMKIPYTVFQDIANFEQDEDYKFEGFPMPYGLNVRATNAGTKEVKYSTIPSPNRKELPSEVIQKISKMKTVIEIIDGMKKRNEEKHREDGTWEKLHAGIDMSKVPADSGADNIPYPEDEVGEIPF